MVKEKIGNILLGLLASLFVAGILAVAGDAALAWNEIEVPCSLFLLAGAALTALLFVLNRRRPQWLLKTGLWLIVLLAAVGTGLFFIWKNFSDDAVFENVDLGKGELYQGKKVMVIVPHQDDELNLMAGVMEEYIRYGSTVHPVYVTNGDNKGLAEARFQEALNVFAHVGIPAQNVIFLGYGDAWKEGGPHLYNAEPGVVVESHLGRSETYGTQAHAVWREGVPYIVENLLDDIQSVIQTYRPDVIYCSDYDSHPDHKATSLAFEKVMGRILKEDPEYHPLVFKGYAYATAWYAEPDFYGDNLLATHNVFGEPWYQKPAVYRWEERVRLPVQSGSLSRSLLSADIFKQLMYHETQEAYFQAERIVNSDKVFWYRDTNSLCYRAQVRVSSGNGELLNDFMLLENRNVVDDTHQPYDGVWIPEDEEKQAEINFGQTETVRLVRLYDNPSEEDNVLAGRILFADGSEVEFGPLDPGGAAVTIEVEEKTVTGFTVILTKTQGNNAGLTEIEAFSEEPSHGLKYLKLMDEAGNFVYDYWTTDGAKCNFSVYSQGISQEGLSRLHLSWDNQDCWAEWDNGKISIIVPEGKTMKLKIAVEGSNISDMVQISNPGKLVRMQYGVSRLLEQQLFRKYCGGVYRNSAAYKLVMTALDLVKGI